MKRFITTQLATCGLGLFFNAQAAEKPNIIYILADDLGYGDIGCYGQIKIETPNIDRLAKGGMLFSQFYAGTTVSAPSRSVLMTGLHSGHTYIRGNDEMASRGDVQNHQAMFDNPYLEGQRPLPADTYIIPKMLKDSGYTTGCVGKWGLGYPGSGSTPNKMGFDFFYGYNCQRQAHTYYPPFLYRNEEREYLNNKIIQPGTLLDEGANPYIQASFNKYNQNQYSPELMFTEIISFISRSKENPFFLFWSTTIPHVPLQAPQRWIDYYVEKFGDEAPYLGEEGYYPTRYPNATYAAMISYLDEQIGLLIQYLKENGLYENTLIIFTSDNGPTFNGRTDSNHFRSAGPFKTEKGWGKTSLHEGGIRVPFIASWPKMIEEGSYSDHISAAWDIMPTFAEIIGTVNIKTDGISILPTLTGKAQEKHDHMYWEFPQYGGQIAVRIDNWKGLKQNIMKGNDHLELYNLSTDPQELYDVSAKHPDIIARMEQIIKEEHVPSDVERFRFAFD